MPTSVIVAVSAMVGLLVVETMVGLFALLMRPEEIVKVTLSMALGGLILWGLIAGHRLAWQWGRVLGMLAALGYTAGVVFFLTSKSPNQDARWIELVMAGLMAFLAGCLYTIFFALGRASAKEHFGLRCPLCGRLTSKAADFLFNKAKCGGCGNVWK